MLDDSNGDICHYNIHGLTDRVAERFFKQNQHLYLFMCNNEFPENKTIEEVNLLFEQGKISHP